MNDLCPLNVAAVIDDGPDTRFALGKTGRPYPGVFANGNHLQPLTDIARSFTLVLPDEVSAGVRDIASLGTWGRNSNAERDLYRWTDNVFGKIEKYYLTCYQLPNFT